MFDQLKDIRLRAGVRQVIVIGILLLFATGNRAAADTRWQVNGVPACIANNMQTEVRIAADGNSGLFIVWKDERASPAKIYIQHVQSNGAADWGNGIPVCSLGGAQQKPELACTTGGAIIFWQDDRNGHQDIYAQRIDISGAIAWEAGGRPVCIASGDQTNVCLAQDEQGKTYVVWEDDRNGNLDIYGQLLDTAGSVLWETNGKQVTVDASSQTNTAIIATSSLGMVVVWEHYNASGMDIYANQLDASGSLQWGSSGIAVCAENGNQTNPEIECYSSEHFFITWEDNQSGDSDIYLQLYDSNGLEHFSGTERIICNASEDQWQVRMTMLDSGHLGLVWLDKRMVGTQNIFYQIVRFNGQPVLSSNGEVLVAEAHSQHNIHIISSQDSRGFCVWSTGSGFSASNDLRVQSFRANGRIEFGSNGNALSTAVNSQNYPAVSVIGDSGICIAWPDWRNFIDANVYYQRFDKPVPCLNTIFPELLGNTGVARIEITGDFIGAVTTAGLHCNGNTLTAFNLPVINETRLEFEIDVTGSDEGDWQIWAGDNVNQTGYANSLVKIIRPRAVSASVKPIITNSLLSGQKNRPVLGLDIASIGWDCLDRVSVRNIGTAESACDIKMVKLWRQCDGNDFNQPTAVLLDKLCSQSGPRIWSSVNPEAYPFFDESARLYFTVDVAEEPQTGATCQFVIDAQQLEFQSGECLSPEALINPQIQQILLAAETLKMEVQGMLAAKVVPGQTEVSAMKIKVTNKSESPVLLQSLTLSVLDQACQTFCASRVLESIKIYSENKQQLGQSGFFSSIDHAITIFLNNTVLLLPQDNFALNIYLDIADNPQVSTFELGIMDTYAVNQGDYKAEIVQGFLPLTSGRIRVFQDNEEIVFSNYPNPFTSPGSTIISYFLPESAQVSLTVWTMMGRKVADLLVNQTQAAGLHEETRWAGKNGIGNQVRSGVYLVCLQVQFEDGRKERYLRKVALVR